MRKSQPASSECSEAQYSPPSVGDTVVGRADGKRVVGGSVGASDGADVGEFVGSWVTGK